MKMKIMKRGVVWISACLILIGILSFSPISLAQEGKWTKKADMPTARDFLATSVVKGKIYAIGGSAERKPWVSPFVEEYDPVTDKWTKKADMPTARASLSASVVSGKIYAIGGTQWPIPLSTVEEYDPGFAGEGVEPKGKLITSWGKIKSNHESLKEHER